MLHGTTYICDRCGKQFECKEEEEPGRPLGERGVYDTKQDPTKRYKDFCIECCLSLGEWLLGPEVTAQKK